MHSGTYHRHTLNYKGPIISQVAIEVLGNMYTWFKNNGYPLSGFSREHLPETCGPKYPLSREKWEYACGPLVHSGGGIS